MPARLDHLTITARDIDAGVTFYDAVLGAAGWERVVAFQDFEDEDEVGEEAVGYGTGEWVTLWLVAGRTPSSAVHLALQVDDATAVDAVAAAGGGTPRRRDRDGRGSYGAVVVDPDGNTVEVFTRVMNP